MTSPRDPLTALQAVVGESEEIADLVDGLHRDAFLVDRRTQLAVGMCFIILGSALNCLESSGPELAAWLPELRDAVGFRNILVQGYEAVEPETVWQIACDRLPKLIRKALALISELEAAPDARRTATGYSH